MDELPTEMLLKILKYLDTKSLLVSRLLNRKWNGIAREILKTREDLEVEFTCFGTNFGEELSIVGETKPSSFASFLKCFEDSPPLMYTRFRFNDIVPDLFDHECWIKFISDFGESIKSMKLLVMPFIKDRELNLLIDKLKDLLLIQLPQLEEFGVEFGYCDIKNSSTIQLFPTERAIQLPHLKVVYVNEYTLTLYTEVVTDLLLVSTNLQKIVSYRKNLGYTKLKNFYFLQSLEKLHCLKSATINPNAHFLSKIKENSTTSLDFKLKFLNLDIENLYKQKNLWADASEFLSSLFESSKNTLTKVTMNPIGFLPGLQLPKFSKLSSLNILFSVHKGQVFPAGQNLMETFPVLHFLDLRNPWTSAFSNSINEPSFPALKTLQIVGQSMNQNAVAQISVMCPNLKCIKINQLSGNFTEVVTAIWTHLKSLQSLDLKINASCPANAFPTVDSCFTGFSGAECIRLYKLIEDKKSAGEHGSQMKISQSELDSKRQNPSILDLKDLKKLKVCCASYRLGLESCPGAKFWKAE